MVAHKRLWADSDGVLCDQPPSSGTLLAKQDADIPERFVRLYNLVERDGRVTQNGKAAISPETTPDALIADRDLWVTKAGVVVDKPPEATAVRVAVAGEKIARGYQAEHGLIARDGRVVQKGAPQAKAVKAPQNKGLKINKAGK